MNDVRELIVNLRGGVPEKCDFCEQKVSKDKLHPDEGGDWICNECIEIDEGYYFGKPKISQTALQFQDDGYPSGFFHWLQKNGDVYESFRTMSLSVAYLGHKHCSAKYIVERLRYETDVRDTDIQFKINNSFTSGMARLFMKQHAAEFPRFFRCRDGLGRDL